MIDGIANNKRLKPETQKQPVTISTENEEPEERVKSQRRINPQKRKSVLQRLKKKQNTIAARYGQKAPEQEKEDMERNRK